MLTTSITIFLFLNGCFSAFMKNKFEAEIENVLPCPNNEQLKSPIRHLKFFRYNRTHKSLNYDVNYYRPLDEKVGIIITADRWGDGGWINLPFLGFQPNACRYMLRFFKSVWVPFYENVGVPHPDRCPIPAGNYSAKDYMVNASTVQVPFFSGRFRFTSTFQDANTREDIFCITYIIKITEVV